MAILIFPFFGGGLGVVKFSEEKNPYFIIISCIPAVIPAVERAVGLTIVPGESGDIG